MARIFITGGAGFIGSCVAQRLLDMGHEIALYDSFVSYVYPLDKVYAYNIAKRVEMLKGQAQIIRGSTVDQGYLRHALLDFKPQRIIHLAAMPLANLAIDRPEEAARSILTGTLNLLEVTRDLTKLERLVYISSSMVYGDFIKVPAPEDHPTDPKEMYGSMKLSGELLTRAFGRLYGLDYSIVRPSAVYGMTDNNRRVIGIFLENALDGKPLLVRGADQSLDFTYVTDTAAGVVAAAMHPNASIQVFNITRGRGRSILEVAQIIAKLIPGTQIQVAEADKKLPTRGELDVSRAIELIGYQPKVDIEEGISMYLDFIKQRRAEIGA
jgi:nucleoside-diphosphate-sugar epimerase